MTLVRKLVLRDSWINEVLHKAGQIVEIDSSLLNGRETNLADVDANFVPGVVQASAIAPTGPNPTAPQQLPPDAFQTPGGYAMPGADVVGETTRPAEQDEAAAMLEDTAGNQAAITEQLATGGEAKAGPLDHDEDGKKGGSKPRAAKDEKLTD